MVDLSKHREQLAETGIQVVVIVPAESSDVRWFKERFQVPFPVLGDAGGVTYASFGLSDGEGSELASAHIVVRAVQAVVRGALPGRTRGRSKQLPGLMLIDRGGRLRVRQVAEDAADHLRAEQLLNVVGQVRELDRVTVAPM